MKQEDKELLLKDLCARLPYVVKVQHQDQNYLEEVQTVEHISRQYGEIETNSVLGFADDFKLYLRPMSSMTEEEKEELKNLFDAEEVTSYSICYIEGGTLVEYLSPIPYSFCYKIIDWLNKNMFDYRGLIPKGLAIAVTKENNPYKD